MIWGIRRQRKGIIESLDVDKALEIINNSEIHTIPNEISNTNIKSGSAVNYLGYGVMLIIGYILLKLIIDENKRRLSETSS